MARPNPFRAVHRRGAHDWAVGVAAGAVALAALVAGSGFGNVHGPALSARLVAVCSAVAVLVAGILATGKLSAALTGLTVLRGVRSASAAVRILTSAVGYLIVLFSLLAVLDVSITHLLVGAGLAGIVLGIAAQQSLGNVFAGLVLVTARPFAIGDHVRIRSGSLGGIFEAWVEEVSLTYVTLRTDDGPLRIPNSAMLAAGVGQLPPTGEGAAALAPPPPPPPH